MDLRLPAAAVAHDSLPEFGTCPLHDQPKVRERKRTFYTATPSWVVLLVVVSALLGLIVALILRKEVSGQVPECAQCVAGQKRFRYTVIASWVLVLGLLFAVAGSSNAAFVLVWFAAVLAALVYSFVGGRSRATGVLSKDRYWVTLKKIEPTFAAKVQARMAASG